VKGIAVAVRRIVRSSTKKESFSSKKTKKESNNDWRNSGEIQMGIGMRWYSKV